MAPTDTTTTQFDHFDHHSPAFVEHAPEYYQQWHRECPVVHSKEHGGFRILTRYDDVAAAAGDAQRFSSTHDIDGTGNGAGGVIIPSLPVGFGPMEMDPPQHRPYRRLITSWLSPTRVDAFEARIRAFIVDFIEAARSKGDFDVVRDLGVPIPACVTLDLLGLPLDRWEPYARPICEQAVAQGTPEWERVLGEVQWAQQDLLSQIADRRETPVDDFLSELVQTEVDGEPLSDQVVLDIVWNVLGGGFDTTSGAIAHIMRYLTEHEEARAALIADPERIPAAVEEFLRYFSPSTAMARTVLEPVSLGGHDFEAGERVLLCWAAANRDESRFAEPDTVDIGRAPNRHMAFGNGPHRCPGARAAQLELRIFLEELLARMPNFAVAPDDAVKAPSMGVVNVYKGMPAVADAG
jgi:cytochrome P450